MQVIKSEEISIITEAARRYNIPRSTLRDRVNGHYFRAQKRPNGHKLSRIEENLLVQWTISMDTRGGSPRHPMVREMADLLIQKRSTKVTTSTGQNWVTKFIKRHPAL